MTNVKNKKKSVAEIITDNIIKKIEEDNILPWQKTFLTISRNYITKRQYRGINVFLLQDSAEWITLKQLIEYNEKHNTTFKVPDLSKYNIVTFFKNILRELTEDEKEAIVKGEMTSAMLKRLVRDENGNYKIRTVVLRYSKVYPIYDIVDEEGNHIPNINDYEVEFDEVTTEDAIFKAEKTIKAYCNYSGVKINNYASSCFYKETNDSVNTPPVNYFTSQEEYYRAMFHELVHSTGTKSRLDRKSFSKYAFRKERSMEELVAEFGSCLLASKCNFKSDFSRNNADGYVIGWYKYIKDHPNALVNAMTQAQKACDYILLEGKDLSSDECIVEIA